MGAKCTHSILFTLTILASTHGSFRVESPIVDTGQSVCYDNYRRITCPMKGRRFYGQDAQYDGLQMSYRNNGDGTITDLNTALMWQKTPPAEHYSWDEAAGYASDLRLAGYDDWRVPTMKELYSLVDFSGTMRTKTPYINTDYFDFGYPDTSQGHRIMDAQYWSSNQYVGTTMRGDRSAFGFNFADGRIKAYPTGQGRGPTKRSFIRCVRGRDGYGVNDFVDNGDGTITDAATGLMWTKSDSAVTGNWEQALNYAEKLEHAGHDDWRLPNAKELQSIVDYTRAPDAFDPAYRSAAIDPIFDLTETESWFWTSATHGAGAQRSDPKAGDPTGYSQGLGPQGDEIRIYNYVRCVRDAGAPRRAS